MSGDVALSTGSIELTISSSSSTEANIVIKSIAVTYEASSGDGPAQPTLSFAPFLPDPIGSIPILSRAILASSYTLYILRIYPVIFLPLLNPRLQFSVFFGHF